MLEEVVVGLEYRKDGALKTIERVTALQNSLAEEVDNTVLNVQLVALVFDAPWLDRSQAEECSLLELENLGAVGCSTLWIDDQRWLQLLLSFYLSFFDQSKHLLFVFTA